MTGGALELLREQHLITQEQETTIRYRQRTQGLSLIAAMRLSGLSEDQVGKAVRGLGIVSEDRPRINLAASSLLAGAREARVIELVTADGRAALASDDPLDTEAKALADARGAPLWFISRDAMNRFLDQLDAAGATAPRSSPNSRTPGPPEHRHDSPKTTPSKDANMQPLRPEQIKDATLKALDPSSKGVSAFAKIGEWPIDQLTEQLRLQLPRMKSLTLNQVGQFFEVSEEEAIEALAEELGLEIVKGFEGTSDLGEAAGEVLLMSGKDALYTASLEGLHLAMTLYKDIPVKLTTERLIKGQLARQFKRSVRQVTPVLPAQPAPTRGQRRSKRLSDVLFEKQLIKEDQLNLPESELRKLVSEEEFYRAMADSVAREYIDTELEGNQPEEDARKAMTANVIMQYRVFPLKVVNKRYLTVLMSDNIRDTSVQQRVQQAVRGYTVSFMVATPTAINRLIANIERTNAMNRLHEEERNRRVVSEEKIDDQNDSAIIDIVNQILNEAITEKVSDIHIESKADAVHVKYRVDNRLRSVNELPPMFSRFVIARLKTMANMDSAVNKRPQDGRLVHNYNGKEYEFRVATTPVTIGKNQAEKAVLRLLARGNVPKLEALGLSEENYERLVRMGDRPNGILLVTGPTGSGKTTTCNSLLMRIAKPEKNTVSVEDPVEYEIPTINQTQVNNQMGLTFATALRAFLRLDPDIIFVGEIRDAETAKIATEAAITGHLVIATLHTNDAPGTVVRLTEMGIEPFNLNGSLIGAVGQRLVRRLCSCKEERVIEPDAAKRLGWDPETLVWSPVGCSRCRQTGYAGRLPIHEVMEVDDQLRTAISNHAPQSEMRLLAQERGMSTMREDGIAKAMAGITSIYEVLDGTDD